MQTMPRANDASVDIASPSHAELQDECQKATLSTGGKAEEKLRQSLLRGFHISRPPQHAGRNARDATSRTDKRSRSRCRSENSPADDLTCPITLELPLDPVTAEDGRVYERSAILSHFERHRYPCHPTGLKSPVTNLQMGRRLYPAIQIRNLIETLIETGAIGGDLAYSWKMRQGERKQVVDLKSKAEGGDADAMYVVGCLYKNGLRGVRQDWKLAYQWYRRATGAGNVMGMAMAGRCLVLGEGVEQDRAQGMALTAVAAERGSDDACYNLGMWFAQGKFGFTNNAFQGVRWLRKALSDDCSHRHLAQNAISKARSKLQELECDAA